MSNKIKLPTLNHLEYIILVMIEGMNQLEERTNYYEVFDKFKGTGLEYEISESSVTIVIQNLWGIHKALKPEGAKWIITQKGEELLNESCEFYKLKLP